MVVLVSCAVLLLGGCGGGGGRDLGSLAEKLREWAGITEDLGAGSAIMKVTEFRPPRGLPITESELSDVSRSGVGDGIQAELAVDGMSRGTNLSSEESKNLSCYLLSKAANGELSLELAVLEEQIVGYIEDRFIEQVPQAQFRADVEGLVDAVIEAESSGEAALNAALATACS